MVKYTCKVGKKIIARDGGLCVKPNGDCTPLYWHLMECNDCYELRREPQPAAVSGKPQSTCICGNPLGIIGVAGEPYYSHVSDGIMVYDHVAQPVAPAQPVSAETWSLEQTLINVCQLLDGWHQDGTAWSTWDEEVRRNVSSHIAIQKSAAQQNAALREELERAKKDLADSRLNHIDANQRNIRAIVRAESAEAKLAKALEELERLGKFLKNAREDSEKWHVAYQEAVAEVIRLKSYVSPSGGGGVMARELNKWFWLSGIPLGIGVYLAENHHPIWSLGVLALALLFAEKSGKYIERARSGDPEGKG